MSARGSRSGAHLALPEAAETAPTVAWAEAANQAPNLPRAEAAAGAPTLPSLNVAEEDVLEAEPPPRRRSPAAKGRVVHLGHGDLRSHCPNL